jgi:hypothetical protein
MTVSSQDPRSRRLCAGFASRMGPPLLTEDMHSVDCPLTHSSTAPTGAWPTVNFLLAHVPAVPASAWCGVASRPNRTGPTDRVKLPLVRALLQASLWPAPMERPSSLDRPPPAETGSTRCHHHGLTASATACWMTRPSCRRRDRSLAWVGGKI